MDGGFRDEHGNIAVMTRVDDVINVAGKRLSSGQLEEVSKKLPDKKDFLNFECLGQKFGGCTLCAVCVLQAVSDHDDIVEAAVVAKPDKLKGHVPVGLCVLKSGNNSSNQIHVFDNNIKRAKTRCVVILSLWDSVQTIHPLGCSKSLFRFPIKVWITKRKK